MTRPRKDDLKFTVAGLKAFARKHNAKSYIKLSQRRAGLVYDIKSKGANIPTFKAAVKTAAKKPKKKSKSKKKKTKK